MAVLTASVVLVTACSSPQTAPSPAPATSTADPLDLTEFEKAPCGLASPEQITRFYLAAPGTVARSQSIVSCQWSSRDPRAPRYEAAADPHSGGMAGLESRRSAFPSFERTVIHNYPAAHVKDRSDTVGHSRCTTEVGVTADTLLVITATVTERSTTSEDPCDDADRFAGSIIGFQGHRAP
ncbi:DUF3558 domain-containing protein [Amycolatopsis sp. H20-H5]|uniref:DUF3558 domain-containing protein n=1 Tax=Amycolatopsis sp. H20-H5 TaxID=3046309 RepID=UPI002DB5583F|nr:DUF3558 domain-containing protein [Amycolatopsis sp. H20-H5]MEC3980957.1 DUF3558 domain-containing protein [Amycolatopsis sp. H20-H5]